MLCHEYTRPPLPSADGTNFVTRLNAQGREERTSAMATLQPQGSCCCYLFSCTPETPPLKGRAVRDSALQSNTMPLQVEPSILNSSAASGEQSLVLLKAVLLLCINCCWQLTLPIHVFWAHGWSTWEPSWLLPPSQGLALILHVPDSRQCSVFVEEQHRQLLFSWELLVSALTCKREGVLLVMTHTCLTAVYLCIFKALLYLEDSCRFAGPRCSAYTGLSKQRPSQDF